MTRRPVCRIEYGEKYRDLEQGGRVVTAVREGGNGVWCEFEDTGGMFHCNQEDFFLWGRFEPLNQSLVIPLDPPDRGGEGSEV